MPRNDNLKDRINELFSSPQLETPPNPSLVAQPALAATPIPVTFTSGDPFATAFDHIAVGAVLTGLDGRFLRVNLAFCALLGYTAEELKGQSFQALTYEDDLNVGAEALRAMLSGESQTAQIQKRYVHKDGHLVWVELNVTLLRDQGGRPLHFVTFIRDVTEQRRMASLLEKRVKDLNCLNDIGHKIDEKPPLAEFLSWVTERIPQAMQHPEVCVAAIEYGGQVYGGPEAREMSSKMVGGLRLGGDLVGWLHIAYLEPSYFIDEESALVGGIVSRVGSYIESQRLFQQSQVALSELSAVARVSTATATILDPQELLQSVVDLTNERFDLYHAHIYLVNEGGDWLVLAAGAGEAGHQMVSQGWEIPLDREQSLVARSARQRHGVIVNDVRADPSFLPNELLPDTRSEMAVPLVVGNDLLGVLDVQSDQVNHFTEQDVSIFTTLANQVAVALQNARQYERTQRALTDAETLFAGSSLMAGATSMEKILQSLVASTSLKRLDRAMIYLFDRPWGLQPPETMTITAAWEKRGRGVQSPVKSIIPCNNFPALSLLNRDRPLIITDTQTDGRVNEEVRVAMEAVGMRSLAAFPLKISGQWIGMVAAHSDEKLQIGGEDVRRISSLMDQAATVAQNLRFFEQTQAALAEAHQSRELINTVINVLPDWIFVKDLDHRFVMVNKSFAKDMKHNVEEFIGKNDIEVGFPEEMVMGNHDLGIKGYWWDDQRVLDTGESQVITGEQNIVDGIVRYFDVFKSPLRDGQGKIWGLVGVARDVTERQRSLSEVQMMYEGSAEIVGAQSVEGVLKALTESTALKKLDRAYIYFFDKPWDEELPRLMTQVASWQKAGGEPLEPPDTTYILADYPVLNLLQRDEPLIVPDVTVDARVDPNSRTVLEQLGTTGMIFLPLRSGGEWFGLVDGEASQALQLAPGEILRIRSLVDQAATVIHGLRLQQAMQDRLQELTSLQRLMSREAWIAYQSQASLENHGYLFDRLNLKPVTSEMMPMLGDDHPSGNGRGAKAKPKSTQKTPYTAPLAVQGEPIGILGVHPEPGQILTREDEEFLSAISEQVAQALERARLMEQTQRSAVELQAVAEVSTASSTILDPVQLLQTVVDLTKTNFGLYHAHVYLVDDFGSNLVLTVGAGEVGHSMVAEGWSIPIQYKDSLVARVARTREGEIISDVRRVEGYLPNPMLPHTLSEMAVPLVVGDKLLGVFDVQSDQIGRFSEEDVRTFSTLAAQTAVALQNAKLYAEQLATVERLRELDNMKSAFLANMSHELRTPLNSILGFTQVILEGLDGELSDLMASDLELIEKNGRHLLNLINDVLDMAKIEAGRLTLSPEPISLYELLDDVIVSNGPLARDKNLYVRLESDPDLDWTVMADHVRMRQIFINLVGNSIKFTESGGITIELERLLAANEAETDRVQVRIRDTGIGIPAGKLDEIFEAFSQVDSTTTRKAGGTGLGLPISRRLVELHGGRLWAMSEGIPGEGSVFSLELPVGATVRIPEPELVN